MYRGHRFAWRYRMQRRGLAPVAAQLAVPVVLGLLIGGVLAYQAGSSNNAVIPPPLGAVVTPTPSFVKPTAPPRGASMPAPSGSWLRSPAPTATSSVVPSATPAATGTASGR